LRAKGPAAVLIFIILGITALGLFGQGELAKSALSVLSLMTGLFGIVLDQKT
jgi:hypothetical protein